MIKIGIIGTPDGWSSETLADTVERKTGYRALIPLRDICLDLENGTAWYGDTDISKLDALIIKKAGNTTPLPFWIALRCCGHSMRKDFPSFLTPSTSSGFLID